MESPRGLPVPPGPPVVVVEIEVGTAALDIDAGGGRGSSAPIPKENSSNDIPLSLPGALAASLSSRVFFLDAGRMPSFDPIPKSMPAAVPSGQQR